MLCGKAEFFIEALSKWVSHFIQNVAELLDRTPSAAAGKRIRPAVSTPIFAVRAAFRGLHIRRLRRGLAALSPAVSTSPTVEHCARIDAWKSSRKGNRKIAGQGKGQRWAGDGSKADDCEKPRYPDGQRPGNHLSGCDGNTCRCIRCSNGFSLPITRCCRILVVLFFGLHLVLLATGGTGVLRSKGYIRVGGGTRGSS